MIRDLTFYSLKEYYDAKYHKPNNDVEAIEQIIEVYNNEMKISPTQSIKDGISEIYRELLGKGLPAYYWLLEAVHRTAKKNEDKRTFGYIVGTIRNWTLYGFGNTLTGEEEEIFDYFTELTGLNITKDSRLMITSYMGTYGALKLMRTMPELKDVDISVIVAEILGRVMKEKYNPEYRQEINVALSENQKMITNQATNQPPKRAYTKRSTSSKAKDKRKQKELTDLIQILEQSQEAVRPKDLADKLNQMGHKRFTNKNMTSNLNTFMNANSDIIKVDTGRYWLASKKAKTE
ncbi:hypothetical protein M5X17_27590 [Paenibacillus alvei]|uniref:hypothetical protein n=1 Tax=Paenibacillus alvei TaxID=44250 RepID=UPI0022805DE3|nr:hypothetical protein [Paenibacillus alvei]MCY9737469.1 hypothetical protein [Paenibacillus alvei]